MTVIPELTLPPQTRQSCWVMVSPSDAQQHGLKFKTLTSESQNTVTQIARLLSFFLLYGFL